MAPHKELRPFRPSVGSACVLKAAIVPCLVFFDVRSQKRAVCRASLSLPVSAAPATWPFCHLLPLRGRGDSSRRRAAAQSIDTGMLGGGLGAAWIRLDGRSSGRCLAGGRCAPRTERERGADQVPFGSAPPRLWGAVGMIRRFQVVYSPARLGRREGRGWHRPPRYALHRQLIPTRARHAGIWPPA